MHVLQPSPAALESADRRFLGGVIALVEGHRFEPCPTAAWTEPPPVCKCVTGEVPGTPSQKCRTVGNTCDGAPQALLSASLPIPPASPPALDKRPRTARAFPEKVSPVPTVRLARPWLRPFLHPLSLSRPQRPYDSTGRRLANAWAMVDWSVNSSSPPSGTPWAMRLIAIP